MAGGDNEEVNGDNDPSNKKVKRECGRLKKKRVMKNLNWILTVMMKTKMSKKDNVRISNGNFNTAILPDKNRSN